MTEEDTYVTISMTVRTTKKPDSAGVKMTDEELRALGATLAKTTRKAAIAYVELQTHLRELEELVKHPGGSV